MSLPQRPKSITSTLLAVLAAAALGYWMGHRQGLADRAQEAALPQAHPKVVEPEPPEADRPGVERAEADAVDPAGRAPVPAETKPSLRDRVAEMATGLSPRDALDAIAAAGATESEKQEAMRSLVLEWIAGGGKLSSAEAAVWERRIESISGERFGLEVELGMALAAAKVDPAIAQAYMDAHAAHPGRSQLFASLLAERFREDPLAAMQASRDWTAWEQANFERALFQDWARSEPQTAFDWYASHRNLLDPQVGNEILNTIAQADPRRAAALLSEAREPAQRDRLIETIATRLAGAGTEEALEWATSLPEERERDAALEAIYHATPHGIGALLSRQDGYPLIQRLLPGGPLEGTKLQGGDLIVQVQEAGGQPIDLHGKSLGEIAQTLRGRPGSNVRVRALRRDPRTGQLKEVEAQVTRDVLIIPPTPQRDG